MDFMGSENGSSTMPIAVEIVERMSEKMDISVMDMPPISKRLDTDALEALIADQADKEGGIIVQFEFQDHIVHVDSDRTIDIT